MNTTMNEAEIRALVDQVNTDEDREAVLADLNGMQIASVYNFTCTDVGHHNLGSKKLAGGKKKKGSKKGSKKNKVVDQEGGKKKKGSKKGSKK